MSYRPTENKARDRRDRTMVKDLMKLADLKHEIDKKRIDGFGPDGPNEIALEDKYAAQRDKVLQTLIEDICEMGGLTKVLEIITKESSYYSY